MAYYSKIEIAEEIDHTKSKNNEECIVWYFNHGFKFQKSVWNGCHSLLIVNPNINIIVVISITEADYCYIIYGVNKSDTIDLLINYVLKIRGFM